MVQPVTNETRIENAEELDAEKLFTIYAAKKEFNENTIKTGIKLINVND